MANKRAGKTFPVGRQARAGFQRHVGAMCTPNRRWNRCHTSPPGSRNAGHEWCRTR